MSIVGEEGKHRKRCGWLFNVSLTLFVGFAFVIDSLFSNMQQRGSFGKTNLSLLPWVPGHPLAEVITGGTLLGLFALGSCVLLWQAWNRLITRIFRVPEITLGEAYAIMLLTVLVVLLVGL